MAYRICAIYKPLGSIFEKVRLHAKQSGAVGKGLTPGGLHFSVQRIDHSQVAAYQNSTQTSCKGHVASLEGQTKKRGCLFGEDDAAPGHGLGRRLFVVVEWEDAGSLVEQYEQLWYIPNALARGEERTSPIKAAREAKNSLVSSTGAFSWSLRPISRANGILRRAVSCPQEGGLSDLASKKSWRSRLR